MRPFIFSLLFLSAFGSSIALSQETKSKFSAFDAILERVRERDTDTGAILSITASSDASEPDAIYSITIKPIPRTSEVLIELRGLAKPKLVYESYRLLSTKAIENELQKLSAVKRSTVRTETKPEYVFLKVPHLKQGHNLCAPTCASMALLHFGENVAPERIKSLANSVTTKPDFAGTYYDDMVKGLGSIGTIWELQYFETNQEGFDNGLKAIIASLDKGCPVIVDLHVPPDGHTVLVNGYDPRRRLISIVDPLISAPGLRQMTYADFEAAWRSLTADIRGGIFTSPPKKSKQDNGG